MVDSCSHSIEFLNIKNNDIINYSILLIRGRVIKPCIQLNEIGIRISQLDGTKKHFQNEIARNGEFKALLDLENFKNGFVNVDLQYCNIKKSFKFILEPSENKYRLQPLYIVCKDHHGRFIVGDIPTDNSADVALQIIDLNIRLVQSIYADKILEANCGRHTFTINGPCRIFNSQFCCEEIWRSDEDTLWDIFAKEILKSDWGRLLELKFIAFISCTRYDGASLISSGDLCYANIRKHLKGHAALGGGGLALFGSAFFYSWPRSFSEIIKSLNNTEIVNQSALPDDSNYRRTYGGVFATTLGAICHELGHTFNLGHTNDGVMGGGFDYTNRVLTINNLTENLPNRIIHKGVLEAKSHPLPVRFTKVKDKSNNFLTKYHEQKQSESFFFTRNCAIILAYNKWLNNQLPHNLNVEFKIEFNDTNNTVSSLNDPLKLIEIRCCENSLVKQFYEFQRTNPEPPVYIFQLPIELLNFRTNHYFFILTKSGFTKRIDF